VEEKHWELALGSKRTGYIRREYGGGSKRRKALKISTKKKKQGDLETITRKFRLRGGRRKLGHSRKQSVEKKPTKEDARKSNGWLKYKGTQEGAGEEDVFHDL